MAAVYSSCVFGRLQAIAVVLFAVCFIVCAATLRGGSRGGLTKSDKNNGANGGEIIVEVEEESKAEPFCTFFNNRAPDYQPNLKNCTWFKGNCCCRQVEIAATFGAMESLIGASEQCQRYTNYLMCYICDPGQSTFYIWQRLTVCREFCDKFLEACKFATLKGSTLEDYKSGTEFCLSRRYQVKDRSSNECFYFDEEMDPNFNNHALTLRLDIGMLLITLITAYCGKSIMSLLLYLNGILF